ncbi:MAG: hypothetical protein M4579_000715 [Chaenotheca gracillima]|nr:MAG: hypothetical protein M4579_000715 [Chaenotheca gracillima]
MESPRHPTQETVKGRVSDMLNDVESQIKTYISEQRARDHLEPSMNEATRRSPPALHPRGRFASRADSASKVQLSLDTIFDTPECRAQTPILASPSCQLRRRGATFHKVDEATADANDQRSRGWDREGANRLRSVSDSALNLPISTRVAATGYAYFGKSDFLAPPSPIDLRLVPAGLNPSRSPPRKLSDAGAETAVGVTLFAPSSSATSLHSSSSSDSISAIFPSSRPTTPKRSHPPSPLIQSVPDASPTFHADDEDNDGGMEPSAIEDFALDDSKDWPDDVFYQPEAGRRMKKNKGLVLAGLSGAVNQRAPRRIPNKTSVSRSQSRNRGAAVHRNRSVSRRSRNSVVQQKLPQMQQAKKKKKQKARSAHKTTPLHLKRHAISTGFGDFFSGRIFHRLEVDEMIDIKTMQRKTLPPLPKPSTISTKAQDPDAPDLSLHPALRAQSPPPQYQAPSPQEASPEPPVTSSDQSVNPLPKEESAKDTVQEVASAIAEDEVALSSPPQIRSGQQPPNLPTILEVSPLQDDDKEAVETPKTTSTLLKKPLTLNPRQMTRPFFPDLPLSVEDPPMSPRYLHGPIRLIPSSGLTSDFHDEKIPCGSDKLDWTAFQIAISGPTGDYFMGGETTPEDTTNDDDLVDWYFSSFPCLSQGQMVRSEDSDFEDEDILYSEESGRKEEEPEELEDVDEELCTTPVELPALLATDPASGRTSASSLATVRSNGSETESHIKNEKPSQKWHMSANLTDLGDYLSAEMVHLGDFDGVDGH